MIDASSAKKVVKRFISLMSEIESHDDPGYRESRSNEFSQFIQENMAILEGIKDPDLSEQIAKFTDKISSSGYELPADLINLLEKVDPENISIKEYQVGILFRNGKFDEVIRSVVEDHDYCKSETSLDLIRESAGNIGVFGPVAAFYSECGKYSEELLSKYLEKGPSEEVNEQIISNYRENEQYENLAKFLSELNKTHSTNAYKVELANVYRKLGDQEKLKEMLEQIDIISLERTDLLLDVAALYEFLEDPANSLSAASIGLRNEPDNADLLRVKARSLEKLGRDEESLEAYERVAEKVPSDIESVRNAIKLSYSLEKYQDALKYLNILKEIEEYNVDDLLKSIDVKIRLSMFDEAKRDVLKAIELDEQNIKALKFKFKLERLLHDENGANSTAVRILELSPEDRGCLKYRMDYLYERGENQAFLDRYEKIADEEFRAEYLPKKLSCLINSDLFDDAASIFMGNPVMLNDDDVMDALFSNVRTDEEIKTIIEAIQKSSFKEFPLLMLVLYKIQGKKCIIDQEVINALEGCRSSAIAHIVAMESIDFDSKTIPDYTQQILSSAKFKQISYLVDVIFGIYSGKFDEDIQDSPNLLYPISNFLILNGQYEKARYSLRKSRDSRKIDPFYYYFEAMIDYYGDEIGSAKKNLAKANEWLTNVQFLGLNLRISIHEEDEDDVVKLIERILEMKEPQAINFGIIENYINTKEKYEFASSVIDAFSRYGIDNIWVKRILRDDFLNKGNYDEAEKVSSSVVSEGGADIEDIKIHSSILEKNGKEEKRVSFLISSREKVHEPLIDKWIGDYFYHGRDYDSALEYYRDAISKDTEPLSIENYTDTLIETGNYEEAEKLIKKLPEGGGILLVKLYHRTGNIPRIVDLIKNLIVKTKEEEEQISYISRILWMNREVRDALIGIYESEGYLFLGKILAQRMIDSHDYKKAIEIMKNIQKNYPEDLENIKNLADALAQAGRVNEAIEILNKTLKQNKDPQIGMDILTRLMRLYFEDGDYPEVIKYHESNKDYVNETSLQYIIRSYMAVNDFDSADKLIGKYEGTQLGKDLHHELHEELLSKKEFQGVLRYVVRLLKLEYKAGKKFDMNEALYKADIPIEMIEKVFDFLRSDEYYVDINEEKYELLSRDLIQSIVKKTKVSSIDDVNISIIYNNLDAKDPVVSKNLYIYIRRNLGKEREPKVHDETMERLLKVALKEKVPPEPLRIAFTLNLGISEAMDVIALMDYMSHLNRRNEV